MPCHGFDASWETAAHSAGAQPFEDEFSVNEDDKLKCRENEWKTRLGCGVNFINTSPLLYDMLYFSIQLKRSSSSSSCSGWASDRRIISFLAFQLCSTWFMVLLEILIKSLLICQTHTNSRLPFFFCEVHYVPCNISTRRWDLGVCLNQQLIVSHMEG